MWKKSYPRSWGKLFERYLDKYLPGRKEEICRRADMEYKKLLAQMPDLGGKKNGMAFNMETWFSIVAFYEASDHVIDGRAFEIIHGWHIDPLRFLGKIIDANRSRWVYKLFGGIYNRYEKQLREHQAKGEWKDSWGIAINPEEHKEGYSFHLIGCPIARHAKEHGYEELIHNDHTIFAFSKCFLMSLSAIRTPMPVPARARAIWINARPLMAYLASSSANA